jgi:hypothetical protein
MPRAFDQHGKPSSAMAGGAYASSRFGGMTPQRDIRTTFFA